ncbi:cGMP-dependent 3',5'-cyclic phosphodiesterase-like isoform X3 [Acanthaster planci]|uniref:Phosphodiesterase n=1 Tax=Acanthaster planci TaxID=133434 RepID=A0A8B7XZ08_ACAPL|nr:cGMP-dependent 3',5'-cyclic phosphodiesterase-like isoform X3 [Acanthaster planci]
MASGTFGQLIASVFSYFRDKSWFLRWRGGEKRTDMDDELQDILLRLGGVTSWDQLREAVRDAVGITLQNTEDLVVYLSDIATGTLVSQDGLAGVVHTLPKSGLAGKCAEEQHLIVAKALDIEDPLCGLLPSASPTLPENRTVACIPVLGSDNARLVGIIAVVCDAVSSNQEKRLSLVGRHIAVCVQRLHQMATQQRLPPASTTTPTACSGSPDGGTCMGSSYDNGILQLCAELHDNDPASMQTKVVKYLERHTQSECCALWIVSSEDATEVFCQIPLSCFNTVVTEERSITLDDISENSRTELEQKMDMKIKSLLCVPVINQARSKVVAVACCINKIGAPRFGQADEDVVRHCFRYTVPVLTSVMSLQKERQLKQETQSMLQVAKNLFTHLDDVRILLREIMMEARNLTQAERCSLFLVENDELVAKVFDGHVLDEMGEVRIPITQGIAGHVATTGKILNIKDAYSHPLFYRGVDNSTGFRTRNILCFPIKDRSSECAEGGQPGCPSVLHKDPSQLKDCWCVGDGKRCSERHAVVGIAELCNKVNGLYFTKHDEEVAAVFSIYCGISIVHSLLYKKMKDAQYRSKLANELMMYHMKGTEEDIKPLLSKESVPKPESFHPQMASFTYSPRGIPDEETIRATLSMFYDMGFVYRYRIRHSTLVNFCTLVRRGYRDPPYHNWYHAFSVGHFCFLLYKNLNQLDMLKDIEVFALFVACICHDLDHRGTNNSFQVHSQSVLAALYSSEGSVMERHHFAQAMCILNTEGCNIFENLSTEDYQTVLDLMQDIILATDLAHHLRIIKELKQMAEDGYKVEDPHCHKLLLCLLMTSCDLSDQTKNWQTTKRIAELIYKEFFTQGDLEKAMGMETPEMYDREKACIPELQINFLNHIALPVYQILSKVIPQSGLLVKAVDANKTMWLRLKRESSLRKLSSANSIDFFQIPFRSENGAAEFGKGLSEETEEELAEGEAEPGRGSKAGAVEDISERNNNNNPGRDTTTKSS